jgi:hypothetical protein
MVGALIVAADRLLAGKVAGQGIEAIPWRNLQVLQTRWGIERIELAPK